MKTRMSLTTGEREVVRALRDVLAQGGTLRVDADADGVTLAVVIEGFNRFVQRGHGASLTAAANALQEATA